MQIPVHQCFYLGSMYLLWFPWYDLFCTRQCPIQLSTLWLCGMSFLSISISKIAATSVMPLLGKSSVDSCDSEDKEQPAVSLEPQHLRMQERALPGRGGLAWLLTERRKNPVPVCKTDTEEKGQSAYRLWEVAWLLGRAPYQEGLLQEQVIFLRINPYF